MKKIIDFAGKDVILLSKDEVNKAYFQNYSDKDSYPLLLLFNDANEPSAESIGYVKSLLEKINVPTIDIYSAKYPREYESLIDNIIVSSGLNVLWTASDSNIKESIENFLLTGGPGDNSTKIGAYLALAFDDSPKLFEDIFSKLYAIVRESNSLVEREN